MLSWNHFGEAGEQGPVVSRLTGPLRSKIIFLLRQKDPESVRSVWSWRICIFCTCRLSKIQYDEVGTTTNDSDADNDEKEDEGKGEDHEIEVKSESDNSEEEDDDDDHTVEYVFPETDGDGNFITNNNIQTVELWEPLPKKRSPALRRRHQPPAPRMDVETLLRQSRGTRRGKNV